MIPDDELQSDWNSKNVPEIRAALKALGESDRALEAGPEVEARLRAAFRQRTAKRSYRAWPAVWAIAAMTVLGIAIGYYRSRPEPSPMANNAPAPQPVASKADALAIAAVPPSHPALRATDSVRAPRSQSAQAQPQEIATDFFSLVDYAAPGDTVDSVDNGEIVRVSLPASAMRQVGLPVREDRMSDRVQADVVMSNGLATAIRFVSYSK